MRTLISADQLQARVRALGIEIARDHPGGVHLVCVLRGAFVFTADLVRALPGTVTVDFMTVSSYGLETTSSRAVRVLHDLEDPIENRPVVIVEDVVDTGLTLASLHDRLRARSPRSLRTACLLDKPMRRRAVVPVDYVGFAIDDHFAVGYGLDSGERYRNLPFIAVLDE
jgi:hypoxanthine phosphoribosyltransferase